MDSTEELTLKQKKIKIYIETHNATEAAMQCSMSPKKITFENKTLPTPEIGTSY